jgi:hypothetical protein
MRNTVSLAYANTLILCGTMVAVIVVGVPVPLADASGHWLAYAIGLVFAAPAITLAGIVWSGSLASRELQPRGFWSRALFAFGIVLFLIEVLWIFVIMFGIGAA